MTWTGSTLGGNLGAARTFPYLLPADHHPTHTRRIGSATSAHSAPPPRSRAAHTDHAALRMLAPVPAPSLARPPSAHGCSSGNRPTLGRRKPRSSMQRAGGKPPDSHRKRTVLPIHTALCDVVRNSWQDRPRHSRHTMIMPRAQKSSPST